MQIVKDAMTSLESIETSLDQPVAQVTAVTPAAQVLENSKTKPVTTQGKPNDPTIVMNGPLSTIYARALNIAFARQHQATGEYDALTQPTADIPSVPADAIAALESQANDYISAAMALKERSGNYPNPGVASGTAEGPDKSNAKEPTTTIATSTSGVRAIKLQPDEIIPIFKRPADPLGQQPEAWDLVFYTDATRSSADTHMAVSLGDWKTSIESFTLLIKLKEHAPNTVIQQVLGKDCI